MSLIALSMAGLSGLWAYSRYDQFKKYRAPDDRSDMWNAGVAQRVFNSTGVYGDISQISDLMNKPGYIVEERFDTDLTGVPCRWLIMRNGGVYKTYDTTTQFMSK